MYNNFFGFKKTPFDIVPNPDLLFLSQRHKVALDHLEFGLMSGAGFILLTGEIGTGKTTLIRNLIRRFISRDTEIALVFQTNVSSEQLLNMLLTEFELTTKPVDKSTALDLLNNFFLEAYGRGRKVLIIVDEAQNLGLEALEEIRMLTNLQSDDRMLLQVMLVGQPELKQKLLDPKLTQFAQRIAVNYHLMALGPKETSQYITYRLQKVGGSPDIFSPEAVALVHQASAGVPRAINLLCSGSLLYAYADGRRQVTEEDVAQVVEAKNGLGISAKCLKGLRRAASVPVETAPIRPPQPPLQVVYATPGPAALATPVPGPAPVAAHRSPAAQPLGRAALEPAPSPLAAEPSGAVKKPGAPAARNSPAPEDAPPLGARTAPSAPGPRGMSLQPSAIVQNAQRISAKAQVSQRQEHHHQNHGEESGRTGPGHAGRSGFMDTVAWMSSEVLAILRRYLVRR